MWHCSKCREKVDDGFDVCWNCGTSSDGVEDPTFRRAEQIQAHELESASPVVEPASLMLEPAPVAEESTAIHKVPDRPSSNRPQPQEPLLLCPRCDWDMDFIGTKSFHEGFQWGMFGDLGEAFVNKESFDLYACPRCGRVEFFVAGIGDQFRPRKATD